MKKSIKKTFLVVSLLSAVFLSHATTRYLPASENDQTAAFQDLVNQSVTGDIIIVESGNHYLSGTVYVNVDGITIKGEDGNRIRKSGNYSCIDANSTGSLYDGIYIDGGMRPEPCMRVFGNSNVFKNCTFRNSAHSGILIHGCEGNTVEYCEAYYNTIVGVSQWNHSNGIVRFNNLYENGGEAITIDGQTNNCQVYGNTITQNNCQTRGVGGIGIDDANDANIYNNTIELTCGDGIKFQNNLSGGCDNCAIHDNIFQNNSGCAVMARLTENVTNLGWWGNTSSGNGTGEIRTCDRSGGIFTFAGEHLIDGTYSIINDYSDKALEVDAWSTENGANVTQWNYHGGNNQKWHVTGLGNGRYKVVNVYSNKALEIDAWSTLNGGNATQWDYLAGNNQIWEIDLTLGDVFYMRNTNSSKLLEIDAWSTSNGANAQQWDSHGGANQRWLFTYISDLKSGQSSPLIDADMESGEHKINFYPNPVKDNLHIESDESIIYVVITDIYGQKQYESVAEVMSMTINMDAFSSGMYLLSLQKLNGKRHTYKFVKQ